MHFVGNCQAQKKVVDRITSPLTANVLHLAENYRISFAQRYHFTQEIGSLVQFTLRLDQFTDQVRDCEVICLFL